MRKSRVVLTLVLAAVALAVLAAGLNSPLAAAGRPAMLIPLGPAQEDLRAAYHDGLSSLYGGGRLQWVAAPLSDPAAQPGDLFAPVGLQTGAAYTEAAGLTLPRAYAFRPGQVAVLRSTVMTAAPDGGQVVAMWELGAVRQVLDGYLQGALPYEIFDETQIGIGNLEGYDLLIIPAVRRDSVPAVIEALSNAGALEAIRSFVENGGTLYAQGTGFFIAEAAGVLPSGSVDPVQPILLAPPDDALNRGVLDIRNAESPLSWSWLTSTLYILDDPVVYLDSDHVVAELGNLETMPQPAVVQLPYGAGQFIGVVGHPTDATRRSELPLFMNAIFSALASRAELYGDAVQTFNPLYPAHEFPAYERVPVSAMLMVANVWDEALTGAVVTETISAGYTLTGTVSPTPTSVLTDDEGHTLLIWELGDLDPNAVLTLTYQAETDPTALQAGVGTFATGLMRYTEAAGKLIALEHQPFVLTSRMAARLLGDRDLEADRHYRIPEEGIYLDLALPLENKEETLASSLVLTDWVYMIVPIVDIENQHIILSREDGETVWVRNEPYLWGDDKYPAWRGATSPTQTLTLEDWRALPEKSWCVFTSTEGIHEGPAPLYYGPRTITDTGSYVTIPITYADAISITEDRQLLLPCLPLHWELGDFPAYWYEEPAVRFGVHSRELFGREVQFQGTVTDDVVAMPQSAGSVYVMAGTDPVPFREYLTAATPYAAAAPTMPTLSYLDVWSRTHEMALRASFYDVWDFGSCATCGGFDEQHAGANVTYGLWADLNGDGEEELIKEIPTRWPQTALRLLAKTYSPDFDGGVTIPPDQNLLELPIFKGLGIQIRPESGDWNTSYRSLTPGASTLVSVSQQESADHLLFQQNIPLGSSADFVVSATINTYDFNREGIFKLHDGPRLIYHQMAAGPNRYEIYDGHVQAAEGWSSDGRVSKEAGPTAVSVYSDTLLFFYHMEDPYEPRDFADRYDPYMKSWGYGDFVATTYVGGRDGKELFHSVLGPDGRARVRISLDNNIGITLTNVQVGLDLPAGITATLLYTDPATAPEPIWPELTFLNRTEIPDAWRSVWYFDLQVGEVDEALWGKVLEIPVVVTGDNLPAGYEAPSARIALQRPEEGAVQFTSAPAQNVQLTDAIPDNVELEAAALVTDPATLQALWHALDVDAGNVLSDTAGELFATLTPTVSFVMSNGTAIFDLPATMQTLPAAQDGTIVGLARLIRAEHGPNEVNQGPIVAYTDPFGVEWKDQSGPVTVEAHGASVSVDYQCNDVPPSLLRGAAAAGSCYLPDYPSEVTVNITAYNGGDAVARGVTAMLLLPQGITITSSTPPWSYLDEGEPTWLLGDLGPGAWRTLVVQLHVTPLEGMTRPGPNGTYQLLGVRQTDGEFLDDYSHVQVKGQLGEAFWFTVVKKMRYLYLPVVLRNYDPRPDLVVEAVTIDPATPNNVSLRISNRGQAAATNFWVDLYYDPSAVPQVNQPWSTLNPGYGGAAWLVTELAPGAQVTLTLNGSYYLGNYSRWPKIYAAGSHTVWAFVDSWGLPNNWAGVNESNETNNRYGPVNFTGAGKDRDEAWSAMPDRP